MDINKISNEIATLKRAVKTAATASLKDKLKKKIVSLNEVLKDANIPAKRLAMILLGAKRKVFSYTTAEFNAVIKRLSYKAEYSFLKGLTKVEVKDDLERYAKNPGWRFKGRGNYKTPTKKDLAADAGLPYGKRRTYYEKRSNRSDVTNPAKLKDGGNIKMNEVGFNIQEVIKSLTSNEKNQLIKLSNNVVEKAKKKGFSLYANLREFKKGAEIEIVIKHNHRNPEGKPEYNFMNEFEYKIERGVRITDDLTFDVTTGSYDESWDENTISINKYFSIIEKPKMKTGGGVGGEYSTKNASRDDVNSLIDMLNDLDISYDLDGPNERIDFDMTELDREQQEQAKQWLGISKMKTGGGVGKINVDDLKRAEKLLGAKKVSKINAMSIKELQDELLYAKNTLKMLEESGSFQYDKQSFLDAIKTVVSAKVNKMEIGGEVKEGEDYLYGRVVGKNYTYTNNKIPNFSLKVGIFKEGKSPNNHYAYLSVPNNVDASILTNLLNKSGSINNSNNSYSNQFSRYDLSEDEVKTIINHFTKISGTKKMGHGGLAESENKEMVLNNAQQIEHHAEELENAAKNSKHVPAWVVAKIYNASSNISDATHYLEGVNTMPKEQFERIHEEIENHKMETGGGLDSFLGKQMHVSKVCKTHGCSTKDYLHAKKKYKTGGVIDINELNIPVIRTQFEDEEYEFKEGGKVKNTPKIKKGDKIVVYKKHEGVITNILKTKSGTISYKWKMNTAPNDDQFRLYEFDYGKRWVLKKDKMKDGDGVAFYGVDSETEKRAGLSTGSYNIFKNGDAFKNELKKYFLKENINNLSEGKVTIQPGNWKRLTFKSTKGFNKKTVEDIFKPIIDRFEKVYSYKLQLNDFKDKSFVLEFNNKMKTGGEVKGDQLNVVFSRQDVFEKAKDFYENESAFYPSDVNDEFKTFVFDIENGEADATEFYLDQELQETDLDGYYFEIADKMKTGGGVGDIYNKLNEYYENYSKYPYGFYVSKIKEQPVLEVSYEGKKGKPADAEKKALDKNLPPAPEGFEYATKIAQTRALEPFKVFSTEPYTYSETYGSVFYPLKMKKMKQGGAVKGAKFKHHGKELEIQKVQDGAVYTTDGKQYSLKVLESLGVTFNKERAKSNKPRGVRGNKREQMEGNVEELEYELKGYKQDLKQLNFDMELDAGEKGNNWTDADANRYGGIMNDLEEKIKSLEKQIEKIEEKLSYETGGKLTGWKHRKK